MQKFVKAFSLAVSAALCIGMLTQYNLENTKADSSASSVLQAGVFGQKEGEVTSRRRTLPRLAGWAGEQTAARCIL